MAELLSTTSHDTVPKKYVRPDSQRPHLSQVVTDAKIPVIDLGSPDLHQTISQIAYACETYGFFQVSNHGISEELMKAVMEISLEFFRLPAEEKMKLYSDDPAKKMRLSTSFNIKKETVRNWRDYLRLHCYPLEEFVPDWPSNPHLFKEIISTYCKEVRQLGFRLLRAISLSLNLEEDYIENVLGEQEQHMAINFYPQCPEPDLTVGLQAHTDPNALTILLQDPQVAGLNVYKDGKWIAVDPQPNALVINLGDQIQALSNGHYKSVLHRAVVNSKKERLSVASFLCPCNSALISPATKLAKEIPAVYRSYTYDEYYKKFWSRNLDQEHCLELFKNQVAPN
ncbi:hypothetical protein LUZ60_016560 [Juncus effusus]|nr:hypothetical protein LUZ60_016560 [Juncus effusus]